MTPEQELILRQTCEAVRSIQQLLKGYDGTKGMLADFEEHKKQDAAFRKEFYRFRTWSFVMAAFAAGGGGAVGAGLSRWFGG